MDVILGIHKSSTKGIFVTSFSEVGNNLNQWRSYCPVGGFSIGFNAEYIKSSLSPSKCLYEATEQNRIIEETVLNPFRKTTLPWLINNLHRFFETLEGSTDVMEEKEYTEFIDSIRFVSPRIKNLVYQEEREWRAIAPKPMTSGAVMFRPGKYFPIPYIPLSIDSSAIEKINIGPTPERSTTLSSIRSLIQTHKISCDIGYDTLPYRSW